ncbi:peroxiredoxin family protein [Bacillus pinisoli]|uniref:peroxiredoxin family protein n=1 Tax=Bacillus pinisoli TaxID=2901866 RepID=UPI001FF5CD5A|nr:TlpA disulfide reductase family protein [Bacillus pinisoli]
MPKKITVLMGLAVLFVWGIYENHYAANEQADLVVTADSIDENKVKTGLMQGNLAPDFTVKALDGTDIKLSDFRGKKVILNLWATWCPPCKAEMPHMEEFYKEQKSNNIVILAVNLTTAEKNTEVVKEFAQDYKLTFPIGLDQSGEVGKTYQAITIPTSYIIDRNGIIHQKIIGPMDKAMMKELVDGIE